MLALVVNEYCGYSASLHFLVVGASLVLQNYSTPFRVAVDEGWGTETALTSCGIEMGGFG